MAASYDMVRQILIRVKDVTTLFRCAMVCKGWRSLIVADDSFLRRCLSEACRSSPFPGFFSHRTYIQFPPPCFVPAPRRVPGDGRHFLSSFISCVPEGDLNYAVPLASRHDLLLVCLEPQRSGVKQDRTGVLLAVCHPISALFIIGISIMAAKRVAMPYLPPPIVHPATLLDGERRGRCGRTAWGKYSFLSYMGCGEKPSSLSGCVMRLIRKVARAFGARDEDKLLWISKLLDTKCEAVDKEITECITKWITSYGGMDRSSSASQQQWPHLGQVLKNRMREGVADFSGFVLWLHIFTEVYISHVGTMDTDIVALAGVCRKLSNYLFYLVVAHPASMVQATAGNPELALEAMRKVH